MIEDRVYLE